ncbi:MAG: HDOD domain-containing protein [Rhodocyclaceae bacterium]|nr:HDOD domain-containing protein [Rhodocyclaceae bacterium]
MHSAHEILASVEGLKSLPAVYHRVRDELESPKGSLTEIAKLLTYDGAMSARLLQVVNSPLYGFTGQVDDLMRAVQLLGMQQVHDLVLTVAVAEVFDGVKTDHMDMRKYWRLSVLRALSARVTARRCGMLDSGRMFLIGLLADLGHLVLYLTLPEAAEAAQREADQTGTPLHEIERRTIGADYAEVGCALLDNWRLPRNFSPIVGGQYAPVTAGQHSFEAAILYLANRITHADRRGISSQDAAATVDSGVWAQLDLLPESLSEIREEAELNLAAAIALFFPRLHN